MKITVGGARPHPQNGILKRKGTAPQPAKIHAGMTRPLGVTRGPPQPRIQGGTFGMGTLKRK
jgi:hypothetical protein